MDDKGEQAANVEEREESEESRHSNYEDEETPMKEKVRMRKVMKIARKAKTTRTLEEDRKECPLSHCDSKVVHLPRHLRNVHNWSKDYARTAISRFCMRKKYEFSDKEKAMAGNRKSRKGNH